MSLIEISQLMGNFGEFFGAIAVVATLAYLALQIQQNNNLQQIEHISRSYELDMAHVLATAGEDPASVVALAVFSPSEMTHRDQVAYSAHLQYLRMIAERNALLESKGLLDENWRNITLPRIAFMIGGNPVARNWWERARSQWAEPPDWYDDLHKMIETVDKSAHLAWGNIGQVGSESANDSTQ